MLVKHPPTKWSAHKKIPATLDINEIFFSYAGHSDKIIDIGCGFGRTLLSLNDQQFTHLTGIDHNPCMITHAKVQRQQQEALQIRLIQAEAQRMPFPDHEFQIGIMQAFLTTLPTRALQVECLKEANRILTLNGRLYIGDFLQTWEHPVYCQRYLEGMNLGMEKGTFPVYGYNGETEDLAHHFALEELVFLLTDTCFRIDYCNLPWVTTRSGNKIHGFVIIVTKEANPL